MCTVCSRAQVLFCPDYALDITRTNGTEKPGQAGDNIDRILPICDMDGVRISERHFPAQIGQNGTLMLRLTYEGAIAGSMWTYSTLLSGYRLVPGIGWCWIMNPTPVEIASILREVEHALELKLYYLAIAVSLSLPDICACLEFSPINPPRANMETYSRSADTNISFNELSGDDLYRRRCSVLHFGHFQHKKSIFDRVIFSAQRLPAKLRMWLLLWTKIRN
jgi:hypothetical protein